MFKHKIGKNEIHAFVLILLGYLSIFIENDATVFVVMLFFGISLLFSKKDTDEDFYEDDYYDDEDEEDELSENYPNKYC